METTIRAQHAAPLRHYILLGVSLLLCLIWHGVLFTLPTDTLVGRAAVENDAYTLDAAAPLGSPWSEGGRSLYRGILRVDARNVSEWLETGDPNAALTWRAEEPHQYLVERHDGGKRVINMTLKPPRLSEMMPAAGAAVVAVVMHLMSAVLIARQKSSLPIALPIMIMACGSLLNLAWITFAIPFSYVALQWPLIGQLGVHMTANTLLIGVVAHAALTFPTPLFPERRRLILALIYGLYPVGLLLVIAVQASRIDQLTAAAQWEASCVVALKAAAYLLWAMQYRRANVIQRGQMHWILMVTTAYDLISLAQVFTQSAEVLLPQVWMSAVVPLGYMMAVLPGRSLRLTLGATSGLIHGVANTLTLALFLSGLGLAANLLLAQRQESALPAVTLGLSIMFALTTVPLANLLRDQFDSWFHGTRSVQRVLLHEFAGTISEHITLSEVVHAFYHVLDQAVQPATKVLWLWNDETQALQRPGDSAAFLPIDSALYERLVALEGFTLASQIDWRPVQSYYGFVVLVSSRKLIGLCAIGERIDGRRYPADSLRFFETLTRSATLAFRNAQLVEQLDDKIAALRSSYQELISAQETERQRLATELHDETLQQLAHVTLLAGGLQISSGSVPEDLLRDMQSTLRQTERGLRDIVRGVHPAVLTDLGLIPALRSWLPHPPQTSVDLVTIGFDGKRLPDPTLELTLYRLCQESVNNALKHARAAQITIMLMWERERVILEVADDGAGFEPMALASKYRAEKGHFGLTNLRERVNALNGQLNIHSQIGHGTRIQAILPSPDTSEG